MHAGDDRQAPDELRDEPELQEVLGHDVGEEVGGVDLGLAAQLGAEAHAAPPRTALDDLLKTGERTADNEQDVRGVDLDELLMGVLATALRRH